MCRCDPRPRQRLELPARFSTQCISVRSCSFKRITYCDGYRAAATATNEQASMMARTSQCQSRRLVGVKPARHLQIAHNEWIPGYLVLGDATVQPRSCNEYQCAQSHLQNEVPSRGQVRPGPREETQTRPPKTLDRESHGRILYRSG